MTTLKVALVGNPNSGKSTVFNALTGAHQRVGNWPGVTVEKKTGCYSWQTWTVELVDLPGIYSLITPTEETAPDAQIACNAIFTDQFDLIINVIDVSNLERNLYLTAQLLEMGVPVILAANMQDVARTQKISIDHTKLAKLLKCPVVELSANTKTGIDQLKKAIISSIQNWPAHSNRISFPSVLSTAIDHIANEINQSLSKEASHVPNSSSGVPIASQVLRPLSLGSHHSLCDSTQQRLPNSLKSNGYMNRYLALAVLEGDAYVHQILPSETLLLIAQYKTQIQQSLQEDTDILIAGARYSYVHNIVTQVRTTTTLQRPTFTHYADKIILHQILGIPLFLAMMYFMFFFAINVGGALQPFFDQAGHAIFVQGFAQGLQYLGAPLVVTRIISTGVGGGINTVLTFIPIIAALFFFLALLESSGYMARATLVVDRCMRFMGLPGKAFVPLIVGFGCNVPAILATRTLEHRRDRLLTLMMTPFMSCSARLAIYTVFIAAFFPRGGQNIVFALYIAGIIVAILTGFFLRKTLLKGDSSPLVMELPLYHRPMFMALLRSTWQRLRHFLFKASQLILPVCLLVSFFNSMSYKDPFTLIPDENAKESLLAVMSQTVTPIFTPMGIKQDNWPATVGLITGILAKEVVVGTLNTLYGQMDQSITPGAIKSLTEPGVIEKLWSAVQTIPAQFSALKDSLINPITASAADAEMTHGALGAMSRYFGSSAAAIAYLLFVLLYFPCISATAALVKESSIYWATFSVIWTTGLAYIIAVIFYQASTFMDHPISSSSWIIGLVTILGITLWSVKNYAISRNKELPTHPAPSQFI